MKKLTLLAAKKIIDIAEPVHNIEGADDTDNRYRRLIALDTITLLIKRGLLEVAGNFDEDILMFYAGGEKWEDCVRSALRHKKG